MGLSSNVLWHQTKKDGLMGILKSRKLYYSYCIENIISSSKMKGIVIPMVSLCDLPLAEFGAGKWAYGNYAIGLSRKWGKIKDLILFAIALKILYSSQNYTKI